MTELNSSLISSRPWNGKGVDDERGGRRVGGKDLKILRVRGREKRNKKKGKGKRQEKKNRWSSMRIYIPTRQT